MHKKVMAFGTFDGFHPGHSFFLEEARKHGDSLIVIVARDITVQKVKGKTPKRDEETRLGALTSAGYDAHLGSIGDKYAAIVEERPDVICLGYDQQAFTESLQSILDANGLKTKIVRLPSHHPDKYKSSILDA